VTSTIRGGGGNGGTTSSVRRPPAMTIDDESGSTAVGKLQVAQVQRPRPERANNHLARRNLAKLADITSTVAETTYTVTSTIVDYVPASTLTENSECCTRSIASDL
jgi:hypothetical protein